jgi:gluconate kinase
MVLIVAQHTGHFFPSDLLDSQLATLEPLGADEDGIVVDVALTPRRRSARACAVLGWPNLGVSATVMIIIAELIYLY